MINLNNKRGRPSIADKLYKDGSVVETIIKSGKDYRSYRTITDTIYMYQAIDIIMEAASDIQNLEIIYREDYVCRSILSQLGRMYVQNNFDKGSVIAVAKKAIQAKIDGYSVKYIETYIRYGRRFNEW